MTFIQYENLRQEQKTRDAQFEGSRDIKRGYIIELASDRAGLVWFQAIDDNSSPFQVFFEGDLQDLNLNQLHYVERSPKEPARWQLVTSDLQIYFDDESGYEIIPKKGLLPRKSEYEWPPGRPGAKALNISSRAITDLAVRPTDPPSMKVRVSTGLYPGVETFEVFQGPVNTKDFTSDVPGAGLARLAAISIDSSGTLNYTNGTTFVDGLPMPDAALPAVPASQILISAIRLTNGMTIIEEANFDLEMRPLLGQGTVNVRVNEVWESDFGAVALQADATGKIGIGTAPTVSLDVVGKILSDDAINADNFAFIVKNTSGATADANDVGFINDDGEYKTTTTVADNVRWCVVTIGAANNSDIHVARRGRVAVAYTGTAPNAGDYLTTSTSAGDALQQITIRPEIFAIALANGSGGTVEALLLTGRTPSSFFSTKNFLFVNLGDVSDFVSTIAAAGVIGGKIYYNAPSSGSVNSINPFATSDLAKIIIHNTTTGGNSEARIIDTGTDGTGNFIQVLVSGDISSWVATEAITARSQTNTSVVGTSYWFDLEIVDSEVPALTTDILFTASYRDTGATSLILRSHPFEANAGAKRVTSLSSSTTDQTNTTQIQPLLQNRICVLWEASGAATAIPLLRIRQTILATP